MFKINLKKLKEYRNKKCPCKIGNEEIICPCIEFCETSKCKCGVFVETKKEIEDIDELVK